MAIISVFRLLQITQLTTVMRWKMWILQEPASWTTHTSDFSSMQAKTSFLMASLFLVTVLQLLLQQAFISLGAWVPIVILRFATQWSQITLQILVLHLVEAFWYARVPMPLSVGCSWRTISLRVTASLLLHLELLSWETTTTSGQTPVWPSTTTIWVEMRSLLSAALQRVL